MRYISDTAKQKSIDLGLIAILIVSSLLISACNTQPPLKNYRTGTDGIVIEFSKSNPDSVYEREEFGTMLMIKNLGATDVTDENPALLRVTYDNYRVHPVGGYFDDYRLSSTRSSILEVPAITLAGRSQYYPVGDEKATAFYFVTSSLTKLREGAETTINYNLCYPYETTITTMTCIDTMTAINDQRASACKSEPYNGGSGQGAPIVITRIEPEILLQNNYVKPQFKIYIANRGQGYVTNNQRCSEVSLTQRETAGRVNVKAWLSETELQCGAENSGSLRLVDSESFIRCSLPQGASPYPITDKSYITPLTVTAQYTYTTVNEWEVEIKRNDLIDEEVEQGICGSYEVEYGYSCLTKCEYCAKHPGDEICRLENSDFVFTDNFECGCNLATCNSKEPNGNCIKGFCPGNSYCCTITQCDKYQVEYNGECVDKCWYCSELQAQGKVDNLICQGRNFTNFRCESITGTECDTYAKQGGCIKGYCGGSNIDKFCANPSVAKVPETATQT